MRRIAIIGCSGSGKSMLATRIGALLGIEVIHLDTLFWLPGWVEPPQPEWRRVNERVVERDAWIIDGNYGGTMDIRLASADTIIFLDLPRLLCIWRVLRRHGKARPDLPPGCAETFNRDFLNFLAYIWRYPATRRPKILAKLDGYAGAKTVVILRSPAEVRQYVARLEQERSRMRSHRGQEDAP